MSRRDPSVAGVFYPEDPSILRAQVEQFLVEPSHQKALAIIVPHAGYRYSGSVAGVTYSKVDIPEKVVLLSFHHRGRGESISIWPTGTWKSPLGGVSIDGDLAERIKEGVPEASFDEEGHLDEHSAEVQIPFLQVLRPDVQIVPVAINLHMQSTESIARFGESLSQIPKEELVICSTDLNHYADHDRTVELDNAVIEPMTRLDHEGLVSAIRTHGVSMCGVAPTIATLSYAKSCGADRATVIAHRTSAETGGDRDRCVGYVGMTICGN